MRNCWSSTMVLALVSSRRIMHSLSLLDMYPPVSGGGRTKRGHQLIVAASPPTEESGVAAEPLTREDLIAYLASGCKSKDNWRIGTEHEKFGFELCKYDQIAELLNSIAEIFEWEKVMEGDKIIGLKQGKQSISLEPGGQFELSGAPLETLHQTFC
ncbi:hypothetical protein Rs2_37877 [Raphanus sativus]|nr:hypothetical protein Rs2_37877 [Raphanus sativus]